MKLGRRPALPVSLEAIERELLDRCGSVSAAARALGVPSVDLRRLVGSRPLLADSIYEGTERAIDEAEQALRDGLKDKDAGRRLHAAVTLLTQSEAGRRRGWGRSGASHDEPEPQPVTMQWLEH
jgi:hypothetical protein